MNDSILESVKKICNVAPEDKSFDPELIIYTNSALMTIMQEWHDMDHAFRVEDGTETWDDILDEDADYDGIKQLVGLKVKLVFDTPSNSAVLQAIKDEIANLEWRLYAWKDLQRIEDKENVD